MSAIKTVTGGHTHPDGVALGITGEKVALFGATPVVQPVGAAQATVDATALTGAAGANPTQAEYATVIAKVNSLVTLTNKLRVDLIALGAIKGAA